MKRRNQFIATAATAVLAASVVAVPTTEAAQVFPDVPVTNGHYDAINELAARGIVKGFPDGTFKPGQSVTRGQAAKMIAGILGLDTTNVQNPNFKDIKTSFQYYGAIAALVDEGIIDGYEDGTYRPDATLTRGHMAKILNRAFKLTADTTPAPFTDIATSEYKNDIEALYDNKVTVGTTATTYSPRQNVTRAQLSSFIIRAEDAVSFELVEVKGVISKIENGVVTIDGVAYKADEKWAAFFSADNAAALVGAEIVVTVQKSKDGNIIKNVKSVKLVAANTTFDAKGLVVDTIEIAADGVTLKNAAANEVRVADNVNAKIENSSIKTLTFGVDAKVAFSGTNKVEKLAVPKGVKPSDVVAGLPGVSDIPVTEYEPPTKPVDPPSSGGGGGGGGGGGSTPSPTNYEPGLEALASTIETELAKKVALEEQTAQYAIVTHSLGTTTDKQGTIIIDITDNDATVAALRAQFKADRAAGKLPFGELSQAVVAASSQASKTALDALKTVELTSTTGLKETFDVSIINATNASEQKVEIEKYANEIIAAAGGETSVPAEYPDVTAKITFTNNTTVTYTIQFQ